MPQRKMPCAVIDTNVSPVQGNIHVIISGVVPFSAHMRTTTELALVIKGLGDYRHQQAICKK